MKENSNFEATVAEAGQTGHIPEKLSPHMISLTSDYPEIDFLLEKEGIGLLSIGDIAVLKGKAKAGKTTALTCLIAAVLNGEYLNLKSRKRNASALYIDTEQNMKNTSILARKVHALCGFDCTEDHPRFHALNFRSEGPAERCNLTTQAVKYFKPDLLVIDGVKDLIEGSDINDPKASGQTLQYLMSLTKDFDLALLTTLHVNKADNNLRGHIGSEILNKSSECWEVKKNGETFESEQTESRNEPVSGFSFILNEERLPVAVVHNPKKSVSEIKEDEIRERMKQCLPAGEKLRYNDLKVKYLGAAGCSGTTAENHISKASAAGYLKKDGEGLYACNFSSS